MSNCINNCRLCDSFILSSSVTFADDTLTINLPDRAYMDGKKYCIVIAQTIPETTTITAPVVFTIGTDTTTYPFVNKCCEPILASQVTTRRIYPSVVSTSIASGVFKYVGNCLLPCNVDNAISLPIPTTPTP